MPNKIDLLRRKFGRLLVIAEAMPKGVTKRTAWLCQCDCGIQKIITTQDLTSGDTKSCGCLNADNRHRKAQLMIAARTQFTPIIAAARYVWRDNYHELSFEEFYELSQQNCYYCDSGPSLTYSLKKYMNRSDLSISNSKFLYNGLDRLDSSVGHITNNVVPSCYICNYTKRERTFDQFMNHIDALILNKYNRVDMEEYRSRHREIDISQLSNSTYKSSVKLKFKIGKSGYNDGNLSLEQFYQLSQLNCYYCGAAPSNISIDGASNKNSSNIAKLNARYVYSGLDRIDCSQPHNYENVIPACKYCNYGKHNLSLLEFYDWIDRLERKKTRSSDLVFLSLSPQVLIIS